MQNHAKGTEQKGVGVNLFDLDLQVSELHPAQTGDRMLDNTFGCSYQNCPTNDNQ